MTDTTTYILTVDGVTLNTLAYNVRTKTGRWNVAAVRGANQQLPGRHGTLFSPQKVFDEGSFVIQGYVLGQSVAGAKTLTGKQYVETHVDTLTQLFGKRGALLDVRQVRVDGTTRQAFAEVVATYGFDSMAGATRAEFAVELVIPGAFWQDTGDVTFASTIGIGASTQTLTQFVGATAPMDELVYTVRGAATNPRLTDPTTGQWVQYTGTVSASLDLVINAKTWAATNNGTAVLANMSHGGGARWLVTSGVASPQVTLSGSGFGANTRLTVVGRRKYLVA